MEVLLKKSMVTHGDGKVLSTSAEKTQTDAGTGARISKRWAKAFGGKRLETKTPQAERYSFFMMRTPLQLRKTLPHWMSKKGYCQLCSI
jgi:hypothetical protein